MLKIFTKGRHIRVYALSLFLFYVLLCPSAASAAEIAAVQSINIKPYNDAFDGLKSVCNCTVEKYIVSEMRGVNIAREVYRAKPDVVVAIGMDALNKVKMIEKPVIYLMVVNPQTLLPEVSNITGVSMNIAADKQLDVLKQSLPGIKNIGILYNPANMEDFVNRVKKAAISTGISITAREIHSSKDYPSLLKSLKGKIEAVWMLPDASIITPETVEFLFLFSINNRIPVITFSDKYIDMGALISLDIDPYDIGKQAGEIVKNILSGTDIDKIAGVDARKLDITINQRTARKLGLSIGKEIMNKARIINGE